MVHGEIGNAGISETDGKLGALPFVECRFFSGGGGEVEVDAFADERGHGLLAAARFGAQRLGLGFGELDEEADHGDITVGGAISGSRRRKAAGKPLVPRRAGGAGGKVCSGDPPRVEIVAVDGPRAPAGERGGRAGERQARRFGKVVTDDAQVGFAPEVGGGGGIGRVLRGEERGSGEDEATHRGEGASQGDEDSLEAGEHTFAAGAVFADDDRGGFAEPECSAFMRCCVFEEFLEDTAP